jgi:hypothetical protein
VSGVGVGVGTDLGHSCVGGIRDGGRVVSSRVVGRWLRGGGLIGPGARGEEAGVVEGEPGQVGHGVGAALVQGALIRPLAVRVGVAVGGAGVAGQDVHRGVEGGDPVGGVPQLQFGHAVIEGDHPRSTRASCAASPGPATPSNVCSIIDDAADSFGVVHRSLPRTIRATG